jgi:hypothetical protein
MARNARSSIWNGKDLPPERHALPAGHYVVEPVGDEARVLSLDNSPVLRPGFSPIVWVASSQSAREIQSAGRVVPAVRLHIRESARQTSSCRYHCDTIISRGTVSCPTF